MVDEAQIERESMEYDVVIVGAGSSGLSAAIRLKQINPEISVVVLEKGSEVGAHILSGAVLDPSGLNRLIPDCKEKAPPEHRGRGRQFLYPGRGQADLPITRKASPAT